MEAPQDDYGEAIVSHWLLFSLGSFLILLIVLPCLCGVRGVKDKED